MENKKDKKKTAVIIVNNEIVLHAVKKLLEDLGYEVHQDVQACANADLGFIGSYFALLGILRHMRAVNPSLPLVLILKDEHDLVNHFDATKDFYDVITINHHDEKEIFQVMDRWFTEGQGKFLDMAHKGGLS